MERDPFSPDDPAPSETPSVHLPVVDAAPPRKRAPYRHTAKTLAPDAREVAALRGVVRTNHARPSTRAECQEGGALHQRPCPYTGCKHHLYLDLGRSKMGTIRFAFPGTEPGELTYSCALDEAERGGLTLEEVGARTGLTRERVRQIEGQAVRKIALVLLHEGLDFDDLVEDDAPDPENNFNVPSMRRRLR